MMSNNSYKVFSGYYDLYTDKFSEDIPFYLDLCGKKDRILETGCGTGRILKHFLENGYKITGVDNSREMLAIAEIKLKKYCENGNLTLKNHDFRFSPLQDIYDKILITWYTFNYILETNEQSDFLRNVNLSLKKGGILIIDLMYPVSFSSPEIENMWTEKVIDKEGGIVLKDKRKIRNGIEERIQIYCKDGKEDKITTHRIFIEKNRILGLLENEGFHSVMFTDGYDSRGFHQLIPGETAFKNYAVSAEKQ